MTDRELLEMAAKAAGIDPNWDGLFWQWNPLTDDGDALRLAVKLGIWIDPGIIENEDASVFATAEPNIRVFENRQPDPYAATRRAIVRAAAEIGKAML